MARQPRLTLPGYPYHVIQRGNNKQAIFTTTADYQRLLDLLEENAKKFDVAVHAYVLMSNHFHLLATPKTADGLPKMMQAVGRSYVRYFNDAQKRSGTLWEGRYKSTLIQTDRYLLACMAYIDLNPVRAGLVVQPQDYPWSSYLHYLGVRVDRLITPHALLWELGNTPFAREAAYAELVQGGISPVQQAAITQATLSGWALGEADFVADLQKRTERRVAKAAPGRPFSVNKPNQKQPE
ncbi:transposase [Rhodoferax sp.]|jgi:putative transposase|uniref:REP-associated tyrosine transposase n=1 Tax=Rhodoferax sp. TaxID=50421 RepID=UPI002735C036|nr:transposase [Rhodoferax sp.]MDP3192716.1 transposase [Rhodoferax sp.]MDP3338321.1 transposase [Rhodoferax sp.]